MEATNSSRRESANGRFVCVLATAAALVAVLAGCSNTATMPATGVSPAAVLSGASNAVPVTFADGATMDAQACKNPKFPLICVKQGGKGTLFIQENCPGSPGPCGKVTWKTKIATIGLKGSFDPNPGNPTTETVTATMKVKPGQYLQYIDASCSEVPNCATKFPAKIIVLKK